MAWGFGSRAAARDTSSLGRDEKAPETARSGILIVEDDEDLRRMLQTSLALEGFSVETAGNGAEGWSRARLAVPGLILLDLVLPWINGLELLTALRSDPITKHVPVIVMTASHVRAHDLHAFGPVDLVHKPFDTDALLALIHHRLQMPA